MTELRSSPGERLIDILRERATFLITKGGKPAALLTPVSDVTIVDPDGHVRGELPVTFRQNLKGTY